MARRNGIIGRSSGDSFDSAFLEVGALYDRLFSTWLNVSLTSRTNVPASYQAYPARHARLGGMNLAELMAEGLVLFGDADQVAAGIEDLESRGIDFLILWVSPKGIAPEYCDVCLVRFAERVMPRFQPAAAPKPL